MLAILESMPAMFCSRRFRSSRFSLFSRNLAKTTSSAVNPPFTAARFCIMFRPSANPQIARASSAPKACVLFVQVFLMPVL